MADDHARVWREFTETCRAIAEGKAPINQVIPINTVLTDARKYYKLHTKAELITYIADKGLERVSFFNKKKWEKNPNPDFVLYVYAYTFRSLHIPGYIAIIENKRKNIWLIKSFHPPENNNPNIGSIFPDFKKLKVLK